MNFDFPKMKVVKAECFGFWANRLEIPEDRLDSDDFELGLSHEFTEETLKLLVFPILYSTKAKYDFIVVLVIFHEITILSLERYKRIAKQRDEIEKGFK